MANWILLLAVLGVLSSAASASNDFTYTGTPVAGKSFTITWTPQDYDKIDILLFSLTGYPEYVPTTSTTVAVGIANSGTYIWDVPADLTGYHTLSMARDFKTTLSFGPKFALGAVPPFSTPPAVTSVAQTTACTSAIPVPTGANPFLNPVRGTMFRVGIPTTIQWQPTSKNNVSLILNPAAQDESTVALATILSNIPNSGSFTWTPPDDAILDADGNYGWSLTIVDDVTQENSTSDDFNILDPSAKDEFTAPYAPLVLGQDHTFYWSPSTASTVTIIAQPYPNFNITIADKVKNTGSFTWSIPSSTAPGEYEFWLVNDATKQEDSGVFLVIDATTPPLCGPQTSDYLSSLLASFRSRITSGQTYATPTKLTTTDASLSSLLAEFSSLTAARTTVMKVTPHVYTTLSPTTTTPSLSSTATNSVGLFKESQSGKKSGGIISTTSQAGGVAVKGRDRGTGIWELSAGIWGIVIGVLGVFL